MRRVAEAGRGVNPASGIGGADRAWWSGRSSKPRRGLATRPRWVQFPHAPATARARILSAVLAGWALAAPVRAQQPAPAATAADSSAHSARRLRPLPAFFHSLVLPGWGQAKLDRKLTAALFVAWEGVTLGMTLKTAGEVRYLERAGADSARLHGKRQERQDWLILLGFNHLFAGLEAYVSSQLQDFPADVRLRAVPRGVGLSASVPVRWR